MRPLGPIDVSKSALLVVDMQCGFDAPGFPKLSSRPDAPALELLAEWRRRGGQVVIIRHDSVEPGSVFRAGHPGNALRPGFEPAPGDWLVTKSVNSAFIGTDLDLRLRRAALSTLLVFGLSTDMCVSTTVRMGANMGYRVVLAHDACAAFDLVGLDGATAPAADVHRINVVTLGNEFAEAAKVEAIIARMVG